VEFDRLLGGFKNFVATTPAKYDSENQKSLTHRNEFLLLAVKEFSFSESYLAGFAATKFFESPQKSGIEDWMRAILPCREVLEPSGRVEVCVRLEVVLTVQTSFPKPPTLLTTRISTVAFCFDGLS